jgi:glycosyltransferase involved in cell wall biosynthesis
MVVAFKQILTLQPFYGASHKQFIDGWMANSVHDWTLLSLPARHWKWRMRHAAIWFVEQIAVLEASGKTFDAVVVTDMLNVAELKGLLRASSLAAAELPVMMYFHENQFAYPSRLEAGSKEQTRDEHFAFTNFVSALAADQIWFNSQFNADSMFACLDQQCKRWPDFAPQSAVDSLRDRVIVEHPGIENSAIVKSSAVFEKVVQRRHDLASAGLPIHIVWAARWEHDKNPAGLLTALRLLANQGIKFQISVLGEQFRRTPHAFSAIKSEFESSVVRWGYAETREDYWAALGAGDVFVSTAKHEFFGLAAAEAIAVGLRPVLPNRLAYPELVELLGVETSLLYEVGEDREAKMLAQMLVDIERARTSGKAWQLPSASHLVFADQLAWPQRVRSMDRRLGMLG